MGEAIGQAFSLGIGVALSPVPIIAVVLMLGTPRARTNGPAFLAGWLLGLGVVGTVVLLVSGGADAAGDDGPATWTGWVKIVLGVLLLLVAVKQWRGRPQGGEDAELPGWMATIDGFTAPKSAGMGALLSGVNPKNLLITVGAAAAIAQTGIPAGEQAVAMGVFVLVGTIGPGLPVVMFFVLGERAQHALDELKAWMGAHNAAIMAVLVLVIGSKLVGDGIGVVV